jgi:type I restriction enzyme S subunit
MTPERLLANFDRISEAPDAIPRLRRFILDLAIRGKLVEQDPNDEPASELLKRIQADKARMVKEGEIRKEKPVPLVEQDEAPFGAPAGWEWVRVRQVTSDRGQTTPDKDFTYIDVTSINKEVGCVADAKILSAGEAPSRARKLVRKGDVLYSCVRPYLLNIAVIESDIVPSPIASTAFAVLNGFGLVLSKYLWIALRSPFMVECVEAKMRGQAYPAINDSDFALLPLPLPPLAEQHRIVAKVDELMALCDRLEAAQAERESRRDRLAAASLHRLNNGANADAFREHTRFHVRHLPRLTSCPEHIQQLRQTILNLAVRGRLVPQDPNDEPASDLLKRIEAEKERLVREGKIKKPSPLSPITEEERFFELPNGWAWTRWDAIAIKIGDIDHKMPDSVTDGVPYVSPRDFLPDNEINFEGAKRVSIDEFVRLSAKMKPEIGDLIYPRYGTIGENRLVTVKRDFLVSYSCAVIKVFSGFINPKYQYLFSLSAYIKQQAKTAENKATQANVGIKSIQEFVVALPPLAEQRRVVAKVQELLALCDRLEGQLMTAQTDSRRLLEAVLAEVLAT